MKKEELQAIAQADAKNIRNSRAPSKASRAMLMRCTPDGVKSSMSRRKPRQESGAYPAAIVWDLDGTWFRREQLLRWGA